MISGLSVWPWTVVPLFGVVLAGVEFVCLVATGRVRRPAGDLVIYAIWVDTALFFVLGILFLAVEVGATFVGLPPPRQVAFSAVLAGALAAIAAVVTGFSWYRHNYPEQPHSHTSRKRAMDIPWGPPGGATEVLGPGW